MKTKIVKEKQDLTFLSWTRIRKSSGTAGSFLKAYDDSGKTKIYYKLSDYDAYYGIIGHECVNELIADRLLTILNIPHLHYQLIHADVQIDDQIYDTYLCASENFRKPDEQKIALDSFYELERKQGENKLDFCIRYGWGDYIYEMLIVDFLILNRDRHGANIEVLKDPATKTLRLAPLFDHGLSFLFRESDDSAIAAYDVMNDVRTNNFLGGKSTKDNLNLIPKVWVPTFNRLKETDKEIILKDLDGIISPFRAEKIWQMIYRRWQVVEDIFYKKR